MPFKNRIEAGRQLAQRLNPFRGKDCVIYALPRGGLPIGYEVAKALQAPLEVILVRKLKAPFQPELALGAIVDGDHPEIVLNEFALAEFDPDGDAVKAAAALELKEIHRRRIMYMASRQPARATGRTAIVVDDGLATGATARAALKALRRQDPKRLVLAVPVAPAAMVGVLAREVDEFIALETPGDFGAVSMFYDAFPQVTDHEVVTLLAKAREENRQRSAPAQEED